MSTPKLSSSGFLNKLWAIVLSSITNVAASNVAILIVCKLDSSEITNLSSSFAIVSAMSVNADNSAPHFALFHPSKNPSSTRDGHNASSNNVLTITVLVVSFAEVKIFSAAFNVARGISSPNCDSMLLISITNSPSCSTAIVLATDAKPDNSSLQLVI